MLAIGRALVAGPRLLLLDEPSLGLAPLLVEEIFGILARINRQEGVTMLLVEQNAAVALEIASFGYTMEGLVPAAPCVTIRARRPPRPGGVVFPVTRWDPTGGPGTWNACS